MQIKLGEVHSRDYWFSSESGLFKKEWGIGVYPIAIWGWLTYVIMGILFVFSAVYIKIWKFELIKLVLVVIFLLVLIFLFMIISKNTTREFVSSRSASRKA